MTPLTPALQKAAAHLRPHQASLVDTWARHLADSDPRAADVRQYCQRNVERFLDALSRGDVEGLLQTEVREAADAIRDGAGVRPLILALQALERCWVPLFTEACPERQDLVESLVALQQLGARRLHLLLEAQEQEAGRRLVEAEEQAARLAEKARELTRSNEALKRAQKESQHRAEQIELLGAVVQRTAGILEPERLMQDAAEAIRARGNYSYVAVVVLDDEGVLVGRWAGPPGLGRRSAGRAQGPAGGVIGRALRKRAPQVVNDVREDSDYHEDVPGTRAEMAIPLLDGSEAVGAIDFQSEQPGEFGLDDVAVGETIARYLVVALRNARLFAELRNPRG